MLEIFKICFEIIGLISAATFFIVKVRSGLFYTSVTLDLSLEPRQHINDDIDELPIHLKLTGGENAVVDIHQVIGRILIDGLQFGDNFYFLDIARLDLSIKNKKLNFNGWINADSEYKYRLNTKETSTFAKIIKVPKGRTCIIEIAVAGSRPKTAIQDPSKSQWRVSKVSFPVLEKAEVAI